MVLFSLRLVTVAFVTLGLSPLLAEPTLPTPNVEEPDKPTRSERLAVIENHDPAGARIRKEPNQLVVHPSGHISILHNVTDHAAFSKVRRQMNADASDDSPLEDDGEGTVSFIGHVAQTVGEEVRLTALSVREDSHVGRDTASLAEEDSVLADHSHVNDRRTSSVVTLLPWQMLIIGTVASAFFMVTSLKCIQFLTSPWPWKLSEVQSMQVEWDAANRKASMLRTVLEVNIAQQTAKERDREVTLGAVHEGEMIARTGEIDKTIVTAYHGVFDQAAPLLARADATVGTLENGIKNIRQSVEHLAYDEATDVLTKIQKELGQEGAEIPAWLYARGHGTKPPPVVVLVSAILAPAQLAMTQAHQNSLLTVNILFLGAAAGVCIVDLKHGCQDPFVWNWMIGFLVFNLVELLCRSNFIYRVRYARHELKTQERGPSTGNAVWDAYALLQNNAGQFFLALHKYNAIMGLWTLSILNLLNPVCIGWGIFGLWITISHVAQDATHCEALVVVAFLHCYSFYVTTTLVIKIINLLSSLVHIFSGFAFVQAPFRSFAKSVDEEIPFQLPLMTTLVQSLLTKQTADADALNDHSTFLKEENAGLEVDYVKVLEQAQDYTNRIAKFQEQADKIDEQRRQAATIEQHAVQEYRAEMASLAQAQRTSDRELEATLFEDLPPGVTPEGKGGGKGR